MTSTSHGSGKGSAVAAGASGGGGGNATCADKIRNGPETDVDCGGDTCLPCPLGKHCDNDGDCNTNACGDGICVPPVEHHCSPDDAGETCNDCAQNGLETDIDCGGDSCKPCVAGRICLNDADCVSGKCLAAASGPNLCTP